ncbi:3-hydroxy-2-methylbutyryl-CoA dehydrogenase [Salinisphaera orenii MK-B5]|uniref:3-hydroxy-2-methylbutyryl-CoA dehydrogenase n=2 Tax=Salinisphaera orenii TaxID=856731 RepID=A0A423PKP5_9GAMM|nr:MULTISPECIES: 3-hydroxyacyl-CoA dehydrogenase [Salinisphaera]ROO23886.1 3-hydroxy-2-methylbutyryl-CoA dehydrogenase [Salinisphaera halophila YIM 95161]ROO26174.1 3-hydroxy-2-methylbutyryl-CoA dehydrogenase [Salinisphaera orenii MK-B5]
MRIEDRCFLITGGGSGLGAASARALVEAGARVVLADIDDTKARETADAIGSSAHYVHCDVTREEDGRAAVAAAREHGGGLHGLINCAGIGIPAKVLGRDGPHDLTQFSRVIQINLIGSFNMIRLASEAIAAETPDDDGERGVIINTASVAAFEGQIGQASYAASKGGVVGMTLPIAREMARHGIRVMTIAPGLFDTPMMAELPEDVRDSLGAMVPFPSRLGQPAEYARLARDIIENPMLNGSTIRLDGAIRMQPK